MMALLFWLWTVAIVSSLYQTYSITKCPQNVAIEKNTNYSINCTTDSDVNDFYWYKGPAVGQDLIGKLEKGTVEISKTHKDDYDVSRSGALLILNARIVHENRYGLVTFDENGNSEEERVIANITISPESLCPVINNCTSCTKCDLSQTEKSSGTLTCRVEGSRPVVPLRWKTLEQNGIIVDFVEPVQKSDASTDLWNSSVSLKYNITSPCGATITIQCLAEDTLSILNSAVSTTEITTAPCTPGTVAVLPSDGILTTSSPKKKKIAAVLIPILIVIGIVITVAIVKYKNKRTVRVAGTPLQVLAPDSELVKEFIQTLKNKSHEKFCSLQPLPWGKKIDIELLYTESLCTVTKQNGTTSDVISTNLTEIKGITNQRLVTFIGEHGDGRTTFFKNIVWEWCKGMEELHLVMFIPLKEVKKDKSLSKYLIEDILNTDKFEVALVEAILKSENQYCLVILDGLEDLSESFGNDKNDRNAEHHVTISEILLGRDRDMYRNFHIWISSREEDWNSLLYPKHDIKVEKKGFSDVQLFKYIEKCCSYYFNTRHGASNKQKIAEDNDARKVQDFIRDNNILKDYGNTPLFINLIIHIMAMNCTSGIDNQPKNTIKNSGSLLHVVVQCMKARYQKEHPSFSDDEFSTIENKLGGIAMIFKTRLKMKTSMFWADNIGEEYVKSALKIGLLKLIKDSPTNAKFSGIEFYHQHIQEYLAILVILRNYKYPKECEQIIEQWDNENRFRLLKLSRELKNVL